MAGGGRAATRWNLVYRRLQWLGIPVESFVTEKAGHAAELCRSALADGYRTILAVGGDGTVHEVVNGFFCGESLLSDACLGVIPAGTGMDFARNLGLPGAAAAVAATIARGSQRRVDVGWTTSPEQHVFVNFAETGLGAEVVAREASVGKHWPGRLSFLVAALSAALTEPNVHVSIAVDGVGVYDGPVLSVVAANGAYFGGGMKIAPSASMEDGELDILVLGDFSRAERVSQIWKIYPGVHVHHPKVLHTRGRHVSIRAREPTRLDLDGELYGNGPYTLDIKPAALRVLY